MIRPRGALAFAACSILLVGSACGEETDTRLPVGNAFQLGGGAGLVHRGSVPGDRYIDMIWVFKNKSSTPVRFRSIEPKEIRGDTRVARLYRIALGPRTKPDLPTASVFQLSPPREWRKGRCLEQPVVQIAGHVVPPGEHIALLLFIEARRRGTFVIDQLEATYEQDGEVYRQTIPYEHKAVVGRWDRPTEPIEAKCAHASQSDQ